jgi:hypothetical protein
MDEISIFGGNLEGRCYLEDVDVDETIILKVAFKKTKCQGVDWTYLPQGKVYWRALTMNLQFILGVQQFSKNSTSKF